MTQSHSEPASTASDSIAIDALVTASMAWKCGTQCSAQYIAMTMPQNSLIRGTAESGGPG